MRWTKLGWMAMLSLLLDGEQMKTMATTLKTIGEQWKANSSGTANAVLGVGTTRPKIIYDRNKKSPKLGIANVSGSLYNNNIKKRKGKINGKQEIQLRWLRFWR